MSLSRCQFLIANGTPLTFRAGCRLACRMTQRRSKQNAANGTELTVRTRGRFSRTMTRGGDHLGLRQDFIADRAMASLRPSGARAGRRYGGIGNGDVIATRFFLRDHIDAEVIRRKGDLPVGYSRRDFFGKVSAHIVYDRPIRLDSDGQRHGHGHVAVCRYFISPIPKLHIV